MTPEVIVLLHDRAGQARGWYDSPEYRQILHLRTDNSDGVTMLLASVDREHRATDVLS